MASAIAVFTLLLIELIALKWLRQETLAQVHNPGNMSAAQFIFDTLAGGLKARIYVALGLMAVIWALCLVGGPSGWAVRFRSMIALDRLRRSRAGSWWRLVRVWVRSYLWYLWLAVLVIVLGGMAAFMAVTGAVILNALLLTVSLWALLYIIATPHAKSLSALRAA